MYRALLIASLLLLKFGLLGKAIVDTATANDYMPEPDCPWPAPPDCEC